MSSCWLAEACESCLINNFLIKNTFIKLCVKDPISLLLQEGRASKSPAGPNSHHIASQADANYPGSLSWQDPYLLGGDPLGMRGSQAWPATQASQAHDPFLAEAHPSEVHLTPHF